MKKEQFIDIFPPYAFEFLNYYSDKFGETEVEAALSGKKNKILLQIVYYPEINSYNEIENVQIVIRNYR